jgi:hypothetical protein
VSRGTTSLKRLAFPQDDLKLEGIGALSGKCWERSEAQTFASRNSVYLIDGRRLEAMIRAVQVRPAAVAQVQPPQPALSQLQVHGGVRRLSLGR